MAVRLTDDFIRRRPQPKAGQEFEWDELVSGFGVRFTPNAKSFVIQWRDSSGAKPRETLKPRFPQLTTEEARSRARARLSEVLGAKEKGADVPLRLAIRQWYEQQSTRGNWRPRYRVKVDSIISTYIEGIENPRVRLSKRALAGIENLAKKGVGAVTRSDVLAVADHIKPGSAEQFMAIGSSFYGWAFEREWCIGNPFRNRLRVTGGRRVRHRKFTDTEFLELWHAFAAEADPAFGAFALLAFTGARRREVTSMRWNEVNVEAATWTLPPERRKTGGKDPEPFVINLHPGALAIIQRQPVLEDSPFVFWGRRDERPFDFHSALMERLRKTVSVKDWRLHDIRRYFRSGLARLGVTQVVAELCLGHQTVKGGLVGVYDVHRYEAEKRDAWMKWGEFLGGLTK